jgi:hypothetical protein
MSSDEGEVVRPPKLYEKDCLTKLMKETLSPMERARAAMQEVEARVKNSTMHGPDKDEKRAQVFRSSLGPSESPYLNNN